jgi:hypothetical protein
MIPRLLIGLLILPAVAVGATFRIATFEADITIPIGHACMGGGIANATEVADPLFAKGFVLLPSNDKPIVVVALDWCQCNNDSYDRWRDALAEAAGTSRQRVMLATVHQHDAPICDLRAQALLDDLGLKGSICDQSFHEIAATRVAAALKEALGKTRTITHVGVGQARIERLASNRRIVEPDGKIHWERSSASTRWDDAPEGEIDPFLKTISLWDGEHAVLAWSCFAIHPMSKYGLGLVSSDFVGAARARRQADDPSVLQLYFTGCGGDTTAGKYNDGKPEQREELTKKVYDGMRRAWDDTKKSPILSMSFRSIEMRLPPRTGGDFEPARMREIMADRTQTRWRRNSAALGLSWRERVDANKPIDVPCLDLGDVAQFVVMPAETFVGYQLAAQKMRPDRFVMVAGFGDGAPGYIPIEQSWKEGWNDPYCWVGPDSPRAMLDALSAALDAKR